MKRMIKIKQHLSSNAPVPKHFLQCPPFWRQSLPHSIAYCFDAYCDIFSQSSKFLVVHFFEDATLR